MTCTFNASPVIHI